MTASTYSSLELDRFRDVQRLAYRQQRLKNLIRTRDIVVREFGLEVYRP